MYISPTEPSGGGLCATQAATHLPALASKHIGSGPGVSGASGMQVQPLFPLRSSFIAPLGSTVTTDALCAMDAGAADSALAIGSPELAANAVFFSAPVLLPPSVPPLCFMHAPSAITPASSATR